MSGVLAVMDALIESRVHMGGDTARAQRNNTLNDQALEARAAVAELIEAATEYYAKHGRPIFGGDRIGAALARVQGGAK